MNRFYNKKGGNTPYNDDFRLIQDNAISGLTSLVKTLIDPTYYNYNMILYGVNPIIISASTIYSYFQVSDGAIWDGVLQEVVFIKSQTLSNLYTALSNLWINTTQSTGGLTNYFDLTQYNNYTANIGTLGLTGISQYQYSNFLNYTDCLNNKTSNSETYYPNGAFNYTLGYNTTYSSIVGNTSGTCNVILPNATTINNGVEIEINYQITQIPGFNTTMVIKDLGGNVIETITSEIGTGGIFYSNRVYKSNEFLWQNIRTINKASINGYGLVKPASSMNASNYVDFVSPGALLSTYPLKTAIVAIPPTNMNSTTSIVVSGGTSLNYSLIYNVSAVIVNDTLTKNYPLTTGLAGATLQNAFIPYWFPNGTVLIFWNTTSQFYTDNTFSNTGNNRGYLIYNYV